MECSDIDTVLFLIKEPIYLESPSSICHFSDQLQFGIRIEIDLSFCNWRKKNTISSGYWSINRQFHTWDILNMVI